MYIVHLLTSVADVPARSALRASSSGDLVVPPTRRRIGDSAFSVSRHTASMEHAADTAEAAAVDHYFPSPTENIYVEDVLAQATCLFASFQSADGHRETH